MTVADERDSCAKLLTPDTLSAVQPDVIKFRGHIWHRLLWLASFAVAMGILEAICCIYLRRLPPVGTHLPPRDYQVRAEVQRAEPAAGIRAIRPPRGPRAEVVREACTVAMLLAAAWLAGINTPSRAACFFFAFGIWDIFFYVGLKWLAGWPHALLEWDCLFVIPKPWFGPVLAPVLISTWFAVGCCLFHERELRGFSLRLTPGSIALQLLACGLWYASFVKDSHRVRAGTFDGVAYSWPLFGAGLLVSVVGLWMATRARPAAVPRVLGDKPMT